MKDINNERECIRVSALRSKRTLKDLICAFDGAEYFLTITGKTEKQRKNFYEMRDIMRKFGALCTAKGIAYLAAVVINPHKDVWHIHAVTANIPADMIKTTDGWDHLADNVVDDLDCGHTLAYCIADEDRNRVADYICRHMYFTRQALRAQAISNARPIMHTRRMDRTIRQQVCYGADTIRVFNNRSCKSAVVLPREIEKIVADIIMPETTEHYRAKRGKPIEMTRFTASYINIIRALQISGCTVMAKTIGARITTGVPKDLLQIPDKQILSMRGKFLAA